MFKFYNVNPTRRKLPDCVARAIALATRTSYYQIMDILEENGACEDCEDLTVECYSKILADLGYGCKFGDGETVEDICREYPEDIILARLKGHLTCCINGCCYDIWDCTKEPVDVFWVIE